MFPTGVLVVVLVLLGGAVAADDAAPGDYHDVEIELYLCATGDFVALYNDGALERLDECTEGVDGATVHVSNVKGERDSGVTNPDGTIMLGPLGMSRTVFGTIGANADGYSCLTLSNVRIDEDKLRPGKNIVAIRLHRDEPMETALEDGSPDR